MHFLIGRQQEFYRLMKRHQDHYMSYQNVIFTDWATFRELRFVGKQRTDILEPGRLPVSNHQYKQLLHEQKLTRMIIPIGLQKLNRIIKR
ncbi:hypothetical protein DH09_00365 (plasmid) [Bacillaceae bacterium JMAK1]|nr:hypothetical protein DH09_00365 [Bacillaceae bacterium JMAK1]